MAEDLFVEIGERLRKRRREMGLTQRQAAKLLGISATYYGEIERGIRKITVDRVLTIYQGMGLDPTYLLTGEELSEEVLEDIFREIPRTKEPIVEQIMHFMALLYR